MTRSIQGRITAAVMGTAIALGAVLPAASPALAGDRGREGQVGTIGGRGYEGRPPVITYKKKTYWRDRHGNYHDRDGNLLAAGLIGFAIAAMISEAAQPQRPPRVVYVPQPVYPAPPPAYYDPYPRRPLSDYNGSALQGSYQDYYGQPYSGQPYSGGAANGDPNVIRYEDTVGTTYEPWTPEWADWCRANYRSFNASTGTYRGYDGLDHFCVVK